MISELSALKKALRGKQCVLLIGPSGVGKTYIGSALKARSLDKFGKALKGKWMIDVTRLTPGLPGVWEGTSDNLKEVASILKPDLVVIITTRNTNMFRALQAMKVASYTGGQSHWRDNWWKRALMDDSEVRAYLEGRVEHAKKEIIPKDVNFVVFSNDDPQGTPRDGWHGAK